MIGETATVGNDVSILHGVTLGGTGKELGDRHPKVQHGVILKDCATVLGNISVGTGEFFQRTVQKDQVKILDYIDNEYVMHTPFTLPLKPYN